MNRNPYLDEIYSVLPRILALFDRDASSLTFGVGDRFYWAWGLIDFGNATFQGAAHGLSRLWQSGLWPYPTKTSTFLRLIGSIFSATKTLTRSDGSLEEAFPREGSYCVTALVAFDLLCTIELLQKYIDDKTIKSWLKIIEPLINYLVNEDESHAFISNHLATATAALVRWDILVQSPSALSKAKSLLVRILNHQSNEGWFLEYQGADPGYQTLCLYYLSDVQAKRPDWNLLKPLADSISFLSHFAHPDGSFAGLYGSRCTRFYFPGGIVCLSASIPQAKSLSSFMEKSIKGKQTVTLSAMDEPNLIPMFNSYVYAAEISETFDLFSQHMDDISHLALPAFSSVFQRFFEDAGIYIERGIDHYSIISIHKGGIVYHFKDNKCALINAGVIYKNIATGKQGSSQSYSRSNTVTISDSIISVQSHIHCMTKKWPNALDFVLLRLLSLSLFRIRILRELIKTILVRILITKPAKLPVVNTRIINTGYNLSVRDISNRSVSRFTPIPILNFISIHMASQGYWQIQDEEV